MGIFDAELVIRSTVAGSSIIAPFKSSQVASPTTMMPAA
jgi:hypothetical protein